MPKVKIGPIVEHLQGPLSLALGEAVREVMPGAKFDEQALLGAFRRAVDRKCRAWESVKPQHVEADLDPRVLR